MIELTERVMTEQANIDTLKAANRVLGIDLGIASCGWALIEVDIESSDRPDGTIIGLGTWMFDAPETDKERTPTNQVRRLHRGQRRVIRRRRQRMNQVRSVFVAHGLLATAEKDSLKQPGRDPWKLRAEALDRSLEPYELAVALGHIARHRGFKSNKKSDGSNAADDSSKMLKAIETTKERLQQFRTIGELFARDDSFRDRKRNRDKDYTRSVLRDDLASEVKAIFNAQRRLGSAAATTQLEEAFVAAAFFQRPLQDSESLLGECPFEGGEKRTSSRAPSFELFRYASRLTALRIRSGRDERPLTAEEVAAAIQGFGKSKKITFKAARKLIGLGDDDRFIGVSDEDEKRDVVMRTSEAAFGTATLREALGDSGWHSLAKTPTTLDRIAEIITFRDAPQRIRAGLEELGLENLLIEALMTGVERGHFAKFTRAGHISAKAARAINPHLFGGLVYSEACAAAGYNHTTKPQITLDDIGSPVARKALSEALKQVNAVVRKWGVPDAIHVELARDIGKSADERDKISEGIEKRNAEKDRLRAQYVETVGRESRTAEDLLRFELWKQQAGRCIYTDTEIHPDWIVSTDNRAQIDHILPWSRFGDDSFHNKVLCSASANQDKRGRTPWEWFDNDKPPEAWQEFVARVESSKTFRGFKKRNLLLKNAAEVQEKFRSRNLNDTRYAARALAEFLTHKYPAKPGKRRVFARPGSLTSKLRQAWGVQDLKKNRDTGERLADDRHHALDALVCAATTESMLQRVTRAAQEAERRGSGRGFIAMPLPWTGFIEQARAALAGVFVARAERRRARGKAHDATIKQVIHADDAIAIYERKAIDKLKETDLANIKDPDRNAKIIDALKSWIQAGKPKDTPPLSPRGDVIRKVRILNRAKDGISVRHGIADRGEMVRVDVFLKANKKGKPQHFLVPIYPHQVANRKAWPQPPNRAVMAATPENEWELMTSDHEFVFSIHSLSLLEVTKSDGEVIQGYFRGMDRSTGAITLSEHQSKDKIVRGVGARTLTAFSKISVDRLGERFPIIREVRTWHGEACISAKPLA